MELRSIAVRCDWTFNSTNNNFAAPDGPGFHIPSTNRLNRSCPAWV